MTNLADAIAEVLKKMKVKIEVSQLHIEVVDRLEHDQAEHDQAEHDQAGKPKEEDQHGPEGQKGTQASQQAKPTTVGAPGQTGAGKAGS